MIANLIFLTEVNQQIHTTIFIIILWIINKKIISTDYPALNENIETNPKARSFKVDARVAVTKYKNIFSKGYTENCSREIFIFVYVLKTIFESIKSKI